ncbi:Alpha-1,3-mannosyl-glycoprotein 2-beta-N-acetylglucosaminyltransferase [Penaeus vannamei]|uniref:Alpha-1,3-mannosyl-glycoprotein 2-beta-N-acetylglucosaminyltransferase n=1 Tax=Penaeus vannamei TaxID=6689 RepID=A0A423T3F5_PENVA|nr:Alpha-1,3-mannosyl-glycoprotein 2-beta-N-acetylglucosaminyltransferase [Penaeus vannamei]
MEDGSVKSHNINQQLDKLEDELSKQSKFYSSLLEKLRGLQRQQQEDHHVSNEEDDFRVIKDGPVLPILLIACNREAAVRRSIDLLLKYRPDQDRFPIIVSQDYDLDVAPDFYEYFSATYPILRSDPTLWCVSAWNDNGKAGLVDVKNGSSILYRTDFFPGLGWMMTKELWDELGPKWPRSYWDDWVRAPEQRANRACIRPEVSRTRTFGKKGVSNGLFYEKHLKQIHLNEVFVPFTKLNLSHLHQEQYDPAFEKEVQNSQVVSLTEVKSGRLTQGVKYKIVYHTKDVFKRTAKALGLMDDFKAGVPRTGYKGVISFFYGNNRIFLAPGNNWQGYNPSWS